MIMSRIVSESSANNYMAKNIHFFMWIYDNEDMRELLLPPWFINQLRIAAEEDASEASERRRRERKHFRNLLKDFIGVIDSTDPNTHPIIIENLTFDIFTKFVNSRKKTINVQIEGTDRFEEVQGYLSKSMYDGMRSALMHLHRMMGIQIDNNFQ